MLDDLKKRFEVNPRRYFAPLANEYRKQGDLNQAIALCEAHLGDQPDHMNGQVVYGQALFDAGRYERSATTFTTALALDPQNLIALRHLGDIARRNGNASGAIEWYQRVLEADPRNGEIVGLIGALTSEVASSPPSPDTQPVADGPETTGLMARGMDSARDLDVPAVPVVEGETGPRPQVFVTETMAELYLAQGFRDEALKVYKQLAAQHPEDTSLRDRVAALKGGGRASILFEKFAAAEQDFAPESDLRAYLEQQKKQ